MKLEILFVAAFLGAVGLIAVLTGNREVVELCLTGLFCLTAGFGVGYLRGHARGSALERECSKAGDLAEAAGNASPELPPPALTEHRQEEALRLRLAIREEMSRVRKLRREALVARPMEAQPDAADRVRDVAEFVTAVVQIVEIIADGVAKCDKAMKRGRE